MSVGSSPTREICSNCNEPFRVAEQTKPDGKGGWRHPGKCGAEWDGVRISRRLLGATPEEIAEIAEIEAKERQLRNERKALVGRILRREIEAAIEQRTAG